MFLMPKLIRNSKEVAKMKKAFMLALIIVLVLSLVACITPNEKYGNVLRSQKQRITSPDVDTADMATLVEGNSSFAFELYQTLTKDTSNDEGNLFYSPYSISLALVMTYAGARDETEQQMARTLHFILPQDRLHPACNNLDIKLSNRGKGAKGKGGKPFQLNIANAIWGQEDYEFLPEFLDLLATNYGAGLRTVDFKSAPEDSRIAINNWVSDETKDRINDLIPQGGIDTFTRLVLTNAIYFNAAWQHAFKKGDTKEGPFYLLHGGEVTVPMMRQTASFSYTEGDVYQAIELPYDGYELSMIILLPLPGKFETFEKSLDTQLIDNIMKNLETYDVVLTMPRYKFESSSFSLKTTLTDMGMPVAFVEPPTESGACSPKYANFSGMTGKCDLYIGDILHKAFVAVDETGTEAAAGTAVIMMGAGAPAPGPVVHMIVDHPFIFLIRDIETGTILFVGRMMNPSK
jgi:serpin B